MTGIVSLIDSSLITHFKLGGEHKKIPISPSVSQKESLEWGKNKYTWGSLPCKSDLH